MSGSTGGPSVPEGLFAQRIGVIGTEEAFSLGALISEVESGGERVIRCNLGQPDFPLPEHIDRLQEVVISTRILIRRRIVGIKSGRDYGSVIVRACARGFFNP